MRALSQRLNSATVAPEKMSTKTLFTKQVAVSFQKNLVNFFFFNFNDVRRQNFILGTFLKALGCESRVKGFDVGQPPSLIGTNR